MARQYFKTMKNKLDIIDAIIMNAILFALAIFLFGCRKEPIHVAGESSDQFVATNLIVNLDFLKNTSKMKDLPINGIGVTNIIKDARLISCHSMDPAGIFLDKENHLRVTFVKEDGSIHEYDYGAPKSTVVIRQNKPVNIEDEIVEAMKSGNIYASTNSITITQMTNVLKRLMPHRVYTNACLPIIPE